MSSLHILESHTTNILAKPVRLQEYGVGIFKTITTKSALKKAIKKGLILVNEKVATTGTFINGNEAITLVEHLNATPHKKIILSLEVIYEDDYLAVINKPPGILVSGNSFKTIANALVQNGDTTTAWNRLADYVTGDKIYIAVKTVDLNGSSDFSNTVMLNL